MNESELVARPMVGKSLVKGLIAIGVFSIFLQVNISNLGNYFIFVAISLALVFGYMGIKRSTLYVINDRGISIAPLFRAEKTVPYVDIVDISISQGVLAKRFGCGTIFLQLGQKKGSYIAIGRGMAEILKDVHNPAAIYDRITSSMNPYSMS
jgi:membrane protein YdbS with pleckstrin-like domain